MNVAQVGFGLDEGYADPDALLERYSTLTGWSEALVGAGAERVTVVQRFGRDATFTRNGVNYMFRAGLRHLHRSAAAVGARVVHVNGLIFPIQTWRLRRLIPASAAIVVQDHASGVPETDTSSLARSLRRALRRRAMRAADGFLFAAAAQADGWRLAGLIDSTQRIYQVMESSTTLRSMPLAAARQASRIEGAPAVLWVGRLNANKDPLTVLNGFEQSLGRLPDAVLTMVYGAKDLLSAVRERVRKSPALQDRVRLAGRVPHDLMPAFYSAADVFVLGSHHEGSGYALLEALACGVTPAVTNIPTFRVMTTEGSIGALWTPGDASSFARALVEVAERERPCRARITEHFDQALSWPTIGAGALDVYRDALMRRRVAEEERATR